MQNPLYWKKKTAIRWKLGSVECKVKYLVSDSFEVDQIYHDLKFSPLQSNQTYLTAVRTILVTHAFSATILVHIAEKLWWWLFVWNQWHKGKKVPGGQSSSETQGAQGTHVVPAPLSSPRPSKGCTMQLIISLAVLIFEYDGHWSRHSDQWKRPKQGWRQQPKQKPS